MGRKILALVENTIGTRLLLSTRFKVLGYQAIITSSAVAFRKRIEADSFDWIVLDAAAVPSLRRRFVEQVSRFRRRARIVWCGQSPPRSSLPIEAIFDKPLQYEAISRFFSQWGAPRPPGAGEWVGGGAGGSMETDQRGQADPETDERREDPPVTG
ncbi:MAG TPA: hypothetical protein VLT62_11915 [Candidatus Methylomirabilis sp.]|nr:hypothetical protein [Candidatus Methylomirabilis sp.]HSB77756.1 hypothetical protein [Candidatus Methylomirabilis sp.]